MWLLRCRVVDRLSVLRCVILYTSESRPSYWRRADSFPETMAPQRSRMRRRIYLSVLASLALHVLLLWIYAGGEGEGRRILRPVRYERAPAVDVPRLEPLARPVVPKAVMEQLRSPTGIPPPADMPLPLPEIDAPLATQPVDLGQPEAAAMSPRLDTIATDVGGVDSYRLRMLELDERRLRRLPLADTASVAGQRRRRGEEIVDRAIDAMGGLDRLLALRDMTVRVEHWDSDAFRWHPGGTRYYARGTWFREDVERGITRGFDGRVSWYSRFGILRPPPDLRKQAERWDFISRFRGDGVAVEYVGTHEMQRKRVDVIRVIDVKYGKERLAYFDRGSGLLAAEGTGRSRQTYLKYREVRSVLVPYLVGGASGIASERWHVSIDDGLTADLFAMPEPRAWEREHMQRIVTEHIANPEAGLRLRLEPFYQTERAHGERTAIRASPETIVLLDTYLRRKLGAAGVLADDAAFNVQIYIQGYYQTRQEYPSQPVYRQIEIAVLVAPTGKADEVVRTRFVRRWPLDEYPIVSDVLGDELTFQALAHLSRASGELLRQISVRDREP